MQRVSKILDNLIRQYGLEEKMNEYMIAEKWETIVGNIISSHSCPAGIHHKKLYIVVDSPVWLQEISFYKGDLVSKVNEYFGKSIITEVYLKTGQMPG